MAMRTFRRLSVACLFALLVLAAGQRFGGSPQARAESPQVEPVEGSGVYLNARAADQATMPTRFSPENMVEIGEEAETYVYSMNNYLRHIQWTSWGGATAEGTGQVSLLHDDGSTSPVTITLGGLQRCAGRSVYTSYSLALASGAPEPELWPKGSTGTFPCVVSLADQYKGERLSRRDNCIPGLTGGSGAVGSWHPRPPGQWWFLCELDFKSWGGVTAVGNGTARLRSHVSHGLTEWRARIEFSRAMWCPVAAGGPGATTYGTVRVILRGIRLPPGRHARRYTQRLEATPSDCVPQGWPEKDVGGHAYR